MTEPQQGVRGADADVEASIADYAASFSLSDVPERVRDRARLVLLDTIGVCVNGAETDYVRDTVETGAGIEFWGAQPRSGSTVFATRDRHAPTAAAFANASGATTLELDEGNQDSGHMGIHVIPPAVALAESTNASGGDLLEAVVLAYEISARLGDVNRPLKDGLHPHGEWAPLGAAVAAGSILGFDVEQYAQAIRMSANPFIGTHWAAALEGATVRNFYSGISCQHGLTAALLASSGVTGVKNAASRCLLPYTAADDIGTDTLAEHFSSLGEHYYLDSSYVKVHAACRYAHAPVEALTSIDGLDGIDPESIERITVRSFESATLLDNTEPHNVLSAKFSIPYVVAARMVLGTSDFDAFGDEQIRNDRVRELARRVDVVGDEEHDRRLDDGDWGAEVEVRLTDGTTRTGAVVDARGGGDNAFTEAEILAKFDRLVGAVEPDDVVEDLRERILSIEEVGDTTTLFADLRAEHS